MKQTQAKTKLLKPVSTLLLFFKIVAFPAAYASSGFTISYGQTENKTNDMFMMANLKSGIKNNIGFEGGFIYEYLTNDETSADSLELKAFAGLSLANRKVGRIDAFYIYGIGERDDGNYNLEETETTGYSVVASTRINPVSLAVQRTILTKERDNDGVITEAEADRAEFRASWSVTPKFRLTAGIGEIDWKNRYRGLIEYRFNPVVVFVEYDYSSITYFTQTTLGISYSFGHKKYRF